MSMNLGTVGRGFADPTHGAQQTFRCLLDAMARPGSVRELPAMAVNGIEPPLPMALATTAVLLCLLDADTVPRLTGSLASDAASAYLRFHTGTHAAAAAGPAGFTALRASEMPVSLCEQLDLGSDEAPQDGATLLLEVDGLGADGATVLHLQGPGIESVQSLRVSGVPMAFWQWRQRAEAWLPRGIDIVLCCGSRIAAIPRTSRIVLEA